MLALLTRYKQGSHFVFQFAKNMPPRQAISVTSLIETAGTALGIVAEHLHADLFSHEILTKSFRDKISSACRLSQDSGGMIHSRMRDQGHLLFA